jgi:tetratricopeptide (TPR) repeat protein
MAATKDFSAMYPRASAPTLSLLEELESGRGNLSQREQANLQERIGDAFHSDGDQDSELEFLELSLKTFEFYQDSKACARMHNKLGHCRFGKGQYQRASSCFLAQGKHGEHAKRPVVVAAGRSCGAVVAAAVGDLEKATELSEAALAALAAGEKDEVGRPPVEAYAGHVRGMLFAAAGDFEAAAAHFQSDLDISTAQGDRAGEFRARTNLGVGYLTGGRVNPNKVELARKHFRTCRNVIRKDRGEPLVEADGGVGEGADGADTARSDGSESSEENSM